LKIIVFHAMFLANYARSVAMDSMKSRSQGRLLDLVRSLSAAGKQVFTTDDARKYLAEDAALWLALTRLQKAGWIKRLKRGAGPLSGRMEAGRRGQGVRVVG
jgi:predicted transcriptional regulator of viral defense system